VSEDFAQKVKTIGAMRHRGSKKTTAVLDERTGRVAGHHIEHWDGRQDAIVRPETVRRKVSINSSKEEE
jgi:hypothetical protein